MFNKQVSANSRKSYQGSQCHFLLWALKNAPSVLGDAFKKDIRKVRDSPAKLRCDFIKSVLGPPADLSRPPLLWDKLHGTPTTGSGIFVCWILSLNKRNGQRPVYSTLNCHRSALFNLYRDFKQVMPQELEEEVSSHFRGLQNELAQAAQDGETSARVGKEPFSMSMYRFLGLQHLKHGCDSEFIFAHCMLTMSWNLMCRVMNTVEIKLQHLQWSEDALCVVFPKMKNDQTGERPRDPRHVYANPLMPEICPVLSLGIYLLCFGFTDQMQLFPGTKQDDRFSRCLKRIFATSEGREQLRHEGREASDFGTHSLRKGSATYVCSGTTASPSTSATHRRCGWSMGKVPDVYLRYEAAGDQHVGRTVTGLPPLGAEFAILPPHFKASDDAYVSSSVDDCILNLPANMRAVATMCLASVVHQRDWLKKNLPVSHRLFQNPLFLDPERIERLAPMIVCCIPTGKERIHMTGVPPHVFTQLSIKEVLDRVTDMESRMAEMPAVIQNAMHDQFEARALETGTITHDNMRRLLENGHMKDVINRLERIEGNQLSGAGLTAEVAQSASKPHFYDTAEDSGKKATLLPPDFVVPKMTIHAACLMWFLGDKSNGIPPLSNVGFDDMPGKSQTNTRKRFSDLRYLMGVVEKEAKTAGVFHRHPTVEQVQVMFNKAVSGMGLSQKRIMQLSYTTAVRRLRVEKKS